MHNPATAPTFLAIHPPRRLWPSAPAPRYHSPLSTLPRAQPPHAPAAQAR